jgi:hypothetical protein
MGLTDSLAETDSQTQVAVVPPSPPDQKHYGMNMPGLVIWVIVFAIGSLLWRVISSPSEGSRRLRIVLVVGGIVAVAVFTIGAIGFTGSLTLCAAIAVSAWVFLGFKKK